jgi:hypothetical protein
VDAEIEPAMNPFGGTPEDQVAAKQADGVGASRRQFRRPGGEEPLAGQKRIVKGILYRILNRVLKRIFDWALNWIFDRSRGKIARRSRAAWRRSRGGFFRRGWSQMRPP